MRFSRRRAHSFPRALGPHLAALEYVLPASLATAYELAQVPTKHRAARPGQAGEVLADCFVAEFQRFALDKIGLAAATVVASALDEAATRVTELNLTDAQSQAGADATQLVIDALEGRPLTFTTISPAVPVLAEVLGLAAPDSRAQWRPMVTAMWLALAAAESVRQGVVALHAEAQAGIIGLRNAAAEAFLIELPETPAIVREELEPLIGGVPDHLDLGTVVDYLLTSRLLRSSRSWCPTSTRCWRALRGRPGSRFRLRRARVAGGCRRRPDADAAVRGNARRCRHGAG